MVAAELGWLKSCIFIFTRHPSEKRNFNEGKKKKKGKWEKLLVLQLS